jgi:nucleoside-diphosphate-sugar epimerase
VLDHSLAEIAAAVIEATDSTSPLQLTAWPDDHLRIDIGSFHTDGTLIAELLGWKASTALDDGLRATAIFYRGHPWYLSST